MSYDGLFTHAMVKELKEKILGGCVSKVHQPFNNELILRIRANRKNHHLLLSAHPQYARVQLTNANYDNPQQAPQFCMVLRKYIENSTLIDIQQIENDRIIEFTFTGRDELGDEQHYHLIAEIMGRHSNVLLVNKDEMKIHEAIRHIPTALNSYRTLLPGAKYRPAPEQNNINPLNFTGEISVEGESLKDKARSIQKYFQGFGRDTATELIYQINNQANNNETEVFQSFISQYKEHQLDPTLTTNGNLSVFTPLNYESIVGEKESFATLSELLDEFYENKAERDRVYQQSIDLSQLLNNERKKNANKLTKLQKDYNETDRADGYRVRGEVLTAYMHLVEQGQESVELENFYDDNNPITITLDPQRSPAGNAQWYFSRYQKMKNRKKHLAEQIPKTKQEIVYIDSILAQLEIASSDDIDEIRDELRNEGYLKKQRGDRKKKKKNSGPEKYYASDGTLIYVGKNNNQNDQLTMKTAHKSDWWLHTKDIPGSHIVIRSDKPSEETIEEAAILAAYFSKYRMSSSVPVDYTQIKHVHKPNGAKPGYVIYDNQNTVYVTPDKKRIKQLKENKPG